MAANKYDPEEIKRRNAETQQGVNNSPVVETLSDIGNRMYDRSMELGNSSVYSGQQSKEQIDIARRNAETAQGIRNSPILTGLSGMFGSRESQQPQIAGNQVPSQQQPSAQTQPQQQPQPQQPLSGLNQNAAKLNGNPDTAGWAGSDIAKANHFSTFGNKWNPSMNTPGLTSFDIPKQQSIQQPQNLKTIQPQQQQAQNVEVIRNGQMLNQSFSPDGTSRMYDRAGNELTRADQEQMQMMGLAKRLVEQSMPAQNASSQYANEQATKALNALNGLRGIPTTSDVQKDASAIRKMDTDTSLAPELAKAEIGLRGAQANRYNTENQYAPKEFGLKQQMAMSDIENKKAHTEQLKRGTLPSMRDQVAAEKLDLDRNVEYYNILSNYPNMDEKSKRELKRQLGINKIKRLTAQQTQ